MSIRIKCPYCGYEDSFCVEDNRYSSKQIMTCYDGCSRDFVIDIRVQREYKALKIEGEDQSVGTSYKLRKINDYTVLGVTGTTCIIGLDCRKNGGDRVRKGIGKEIEAVIEEATKLLNKNPHLKIYQAIALAKETLKHRKRAPN